MSETKVTLGNCEHRNPGMRGGSACGIDRWPCPHWNRVEVCTLPPGCPYKPAPAPKTRLARVKVEEITTLLGCRLEYQLDGQRRWLSSAIDDPSFRGYLWPDGARDIGTPWRWAEKSGDRIEHATEVEFEIGGE